MIDNLSILLVDDDDVATESVERSFRKAQLEVAVVTAENGEMALRILRNQHPERHIAKPYVVLLDLNMPRMNGFEFLEHVRADESLDETVVFVLSTSDAEADRNRAYHQGIAGYMVKSEVGPQFAKLTELLQAYRLAVAPPCDYPVVN